MADEERQLGSSDFGTLLRRYRIAAGFSQEELAERAHLSANGIGALERGYRRAPQRETLALIVRALGLCESLQHDLEVAAASRRASVRGSTPLNLQGANAATFLPLSLAEFVGRETVLDAIAGLVCEHRLVTITGAGGIGKTQTALRAVASLEAGRTSNVRFIGLAPLADPGLVVSAIAASCGVKEVLHQPLLETVVASLRNHPLLLILDNCEHVVAEAARVAEVLLSSCPELRILATSREPLRSAGEHTYRLPSLTLEDAVALFVARARAADHRFVLDDANASAVSEICRRLDGIPLAIELAAARVRTLSIPNLAQRLNERFKILTGGSRTALPRQKTLSALIDWSYDLLTPQEQMLFSRVGIFAGGFSLDAATAVCSGEDLDEIDILDLLSSLTDKSLVVADTAGEQERCHLLESTRAYALEKLRAAGAHEQLARRHAEYFRDQAQQADEDSGTGSTAAWLASVERELDNYRAVLDWSLKDGHDVALGAAVAGALGTLWLNGGLTVEGRYWIGLAQAGLNESMHPQVASRLWRALDAHSSGKHKNDCAQRALALSQSVGDEKGQALALASLALSLVQMGRFEEASEVNARALAAMRKLDNKPGVADCLGARAIIQRGCGDVTTARELFAEALAAHKALGNEAAATVALGNLAELEFGDGQVELALRLAGEALEIQSRGKNMKSLTIAYLNVAAYRIALGDVDGAREAAREGLRWARQGRFALSMAIALQHIALLLALRGEVNDAAQLIGYANVQLKELGSEREATEAWGYEKLMAVLRDRLSDAEIEKLAAEGATWPEDRVAEQALKV